MIGLVRFVGYFVALAVVDIACDMWEVRKMNREMTRYTNDNGGEVSAHVVTEDTAGSVMTVGGSSRDVTAGEVLLGTDRADVYHVTDSAALDAYAAAEDDSEGAGETGQDVTGYNPSDYNASEVRAHLRSLRDAGDRAEYERVTAAEREGYNRSSALDGEFDR